MWKDGEGEDEMCAVKRISKTEKASTSVAKIFTEVSIHLRLNDPHILRLYNVIEDSSYVYLILELCDGGTLAQYLKSKTESKEKVEKKGSFEKQKAQIKPVISYTAIRNVVKQLCKGLAYLHRNNIVHRDLNLNNVLIVSRNVKEDDLKIKIADFGLAIDLNSSRQKSDILTRKIDINLPAGTTICGTPGYISPEVWSQTSVVSTASDLFSLGSVLFALVTGCTPKGDLVRSERDPVNHVFFT